MSASLSWLEALFLPPEIGTAAAAAVTVLAALPLPAPIHPLDPPLRVVAPHLTAERRAAWISVLTEPLTQAAITTARPVAAFLAQCAVESGGFRDLEEDLGYSAARLCEVWPNRFPTMADAEACAHQPEVLANRVYAARLGNGDEASGDGWRFRGRGLIQITGRTAYERFAMSMNMTLDDAVEHAATDAGAAQSAAWFWSANQLNALAETWSVDLITRKVNGGTNGAAERNRLSEAALQAIGA